MLRTLLVSALAFFLAFFTLRLPTLSLDAFSDNSQNQLTTLWLRVLKQLHLVAKDDLTVELDYGYFRGREEDDVQMWLGIPYAQDPYVSFSHTSHQYLIDSRISIGPLRFAAPRPLTDVAGCDKEIFNATQYSPACPSQHLTMNPDLKIPLPEQKGHVPEDEACLSVNVFRPKGLPKGAKVPVIFVSVHGVCVYKSKSSLT